MTNDIELRPCPFCGGRVQITDGITLPIYMVYCEHCGARVSFEPDSQKLATTYAAWNRRAE